MSDNIETLRIWLKEQCGINYTIDELVNLQELDLEDNKLTVLPPEIGLLQNLQKLSLRGNELTSIPSEIEKLTNLHSSSISLANTHSIPILLNAW
jgi:Leucine-rich repeat (LRR) protein